MKCLRTVVGALLFGVSVAAAEVNVEIRQTGRDPQRHRPFVMTLSQEGRDLYCKTESVPRHKIEVPELKSLKNPFSPKMPSNCDESLKWDGTLSCPTPADRPLLKKLVRWCTH